MSLFTETMYDNAHSSRKGLNTGEPDASVRHTWSQAHERGRRVAGGLAAAGVGQVIGAINSYANDRDAFGRQAVRLDSGPGAAVRVVDGGLQIGLREVQQGHARQLGCRGRTQATECR